MKFCLAIATAACLLLVTGSASAHTLPANGVNPPMYSGWLEDWKFEQLQAAAAAPAPAVVTRSARCRNGFAGPYPCDNVDLKGQLTLAEMGGTFGNDIWGWIDPKTDREYAIMGMTEGTAFVDITRAGNPRFLGLLPSQTVDPGRPFWRDIKVYKNDAFIVGEQRGHHMQVFDLTRLRGLERQAAPTTFTADNVYVIPNADGVTPSIGNTHNLDINEKTGFAYLVGTSTCGNGSRNGGLHMVDIRDPRNPEFAGCFGADGYTHDTQCEIYRGPDRRFRGREICFASNEDTVTIVDVTDKSNPAMLSRTGYPEARYTHQGWLTENWRHFVFNDELDEAGRGPSAPPTVPVQTTYFLPVESLTAPGAVRKSPNNTTSTDHNLYISEGSIVESNYTSGLRIFDEDRVPGDLGQESAFFDVYPENDNPGFEGGTWSNFGYGEYEDDKIAVSSIDRGLFVLEPDIDDDDDDDDEDDDDEDDDD